MTIVCDRPLNPPPLPLPPTLKQQLVTEALEQYRDNMVTAGNTDLTDDTILRAGQYLLDVSVASPCSPASASLGHRHPA